MPYDPNEVMGLTALSPTVAAYKQFMERQNNVGDSNIVPFLVSRGEPQLAGLIAKKLRVENAAKSQQQLAQQPPASPPTVADQYDMAAQQQAMMAPGLPGMPNPAMDQASFAGGGIVAFADGGGVPSNVARMNAALREAMAKLEAAKNSGNPAAVQAATAEVASLRSRIAGIPKLLDKPVGQLARDVGTKLASGTGGVRNFLTTGGGRVNVPVAYMTTAAGAYGTPTEDYARRINAEPGTSVMKDLGIRGLGALQDLGNVVTFGLADRLGNLIGGGGFNRSEYYADEEPTAPTTARPAPTPAPAPTEGGVDAAAELDRYLGLGSIAPGPNRRPQAAPSAAKAQAPATTPAAPEPDALAKLREEVEKLNPEEVKKTTVVSKALDDEEAFIKARKEEAGVSRKQASTEFLINLGASLLANRSPHFTVALGEALKESYGTMSQNLRELKKDADALKIQELKVQAAREQLQRDQDSEAQKTYNDQFRAYQNAVVQFEERRAILADNLLEREFRREQDALNRASAERVEASRQDPLQEMRAEYSRLTRAVNDPKLPSQVRAVAARRAEGILTAIRNLTIAGSGSVQAANVRADNQPNPYAIPGGGSSTDGWGDVSIR